MIFYGCASPSAEQLSGSEASFREQPAPGREMEFGSLEIASGCDCNIL